MSVPSARRADEAAPSERGWHRTFGAILFCQLIAAVSFTSAMPFLPLYLRELGESETGAAIWSGAINSITSVVLIVATPLWGALADKVGRKPMVVRALLGSGTSLAITGLAAQAWQLVPLRAFQGAFAGTNSALVALSATILPTHRLGMGMGVLQTAQFLGGSLGPLLGGWAIAAFGFRGAFAVAGGMSIILAGIFAALVKEPPIQRSARSAPNQSILSRLTLATRVPSLRPPLITLLGFQTAYTVSWTLLPLHLASVAGNEAEARTLVGLVVTANALGIAAGATALGWVGGRVGTTRVAVLSLAGVALFSILQATPLSPMGFIPARLGLGFCAGGILPSLRAALGHEAARNPALAGQLGSVYGLAQSAFSAGMVFGPPIGSLFATVWGLPSMHVVSAAIALVTAFWYWRATTRQ